MATSGISVASRAADRAWDSPALRLLDADTASRKAPEELVLTIEFRSSEGRSWTAIGGGPTVAAAID